MCFPYTQLLLPCPWQRDHTAWIAASAQAESSHDTAHRFFRAVMRLFAAAAAPCHWTPAQHSGLQISISLPHSLYALHRWLVSYKVVRMCLRMRSGQTNTAHRFLCVVQEVSMLCSPTDFTCDRVMSGHLLLAAHDVAQAAIGFILAHHCFVPAFSTKVCSLIRIHPLSLA